MRIIFTLAAALLIACPAWLYADPFYPGTNVQVQPGGVRVQVTPGVYNPGYAPVYSSPVVVTRPVRPVRGLLGLLGRSLRRYAPATIYVAPPVQAPLVTPPVQPPQQVFHPQVVDAPAAGGNHPIIGAGPGAPSLPMTVTPPVKAFETPEVAPERVGGMNPSLAPREPFRLPNKLEELPPGAANKTPFENVVTRAQRPAAPAASHVALNKRAENLIEQGDTLFAAQRFHEAGQRYKSAIAASPHHGGAYFRRAIALVATNRYDLAEPIARRGAVVDPEFVRGSFRLDDLYDGAKLAKNSHLDALARTALVNDHLAANWFLVGMFLHFDGQADRAQSFLRKAAQLETNDASYIAPFLQQKPARADAPATRSVLQPAG